MAVHPQISPETLKQILKTVQAATQQAMPAAAQAVAAQPTTTTKDKLKAFATGAGNVLKAVAPELLGLVPGVGPMLKILGTTLNDDEWFSEYTSAGVTANEYLQLVDYTGAGVYQTTAAIAEVLCDISSFQEFTDNFMPTVLAYVRNHTNNVLVEDTNKYTEAFIAASQLYAFYYQGMKYIKLSEHQPLNIPLLPNVIKAIEPKTYSQFKGVVEALGDFLKSTVRLPYAWVAYLRWRFGTTFLSDNTGKPGLIMYDIAKVMGDQGETPDEILRIYYDAVESIKAEYIGAGRAGADIKLAYDAHTIHYDVEDAHHDAKEYNLRTNLTLTYEEFKAPAPYDSTMVFIDSRLNQTAALQAVTISTATDYAPIRCRDIILGVYVPDNIDLGLGYIDGGLSASESWTRTVTLGAGWHTFGYGYSRNAYHPSETIMIATSDGRTSAYPAVISGQDVTVTTDLKSSTGTNITVFRGANNGYDITEWLKSADLSAIAATLFLRDALATPLLTSLQFHNVGNFVNLWGKRFCPTSLAYDMAVVPKTTIANIQRTAMRNLIRGDYRAKIQPTQKPEVKKAIAEVESVAIKDVAEHMPTTATAKPTVK